MERIAAGDPGAIETFYALLRQRLRGHIQHRLHDGDPDDILHETLMITLEGIRKGVIRHPAALRAYAETVTRRLIAGVVVSAIARRRRMVDMQSLDDLAGMSDGPEVAMLARERKGLVAEGLRQLRSRDCELLTRFYLDGESLRSICDGMHLTDTQFRLYKSRAKARLSALVDHAA